MRRARLPRNVRLTLVLLVLAGLLAWQYDRPPGAADAGTGAPAEENTVQAAWTARRSGVWLEAAGRVTRLLADDNEGSRHQRFIMDVGDGHTVMVAHNIDLAERVPARVGDILTLRGRYEWNGHGGVIHWTHHDPQGREPGGWIRRGDAVFE